MFECHFKMFHVAPLCPPSPHQQGYTLKEPHCPSRSVFLLSKRPQAVMVTSENVPDPQLLIGRCFLINNNASVSPSLQNIYTLTAIGPHRHEEIQ